jgi:hypothetical protein
VFTSPFYRIDSSSVVACLFISARTRLPSRCLAMNVHSGSAISAFRRHITMYSVDWYEGYWMMNRREYGVVTCNTGRYWRIPRTPSVWRVSMPV